MSTLDVTIQQEVIRAEIIEDIINVSTQNQTLGVLTIVEKGDPGPSDHGMLSGLGDDDHPQYSLADGTRSFTGVVSGITPTANTHLTTKGFVDSKARQVSLTVLQPQLVQAVADDIAYIYVGSDAFPNGIEITQLHLATPVSSTYSLTLNQRLSPNGSDTAIATIATSASTEADVTPAGTNGKVPAGSYIFVDFPTTSLSWFQLTLTYQELLV